MLCCLARPFSPSQHRPCPPRPPFSKGLLAASSEIGRVGIEAARRARLVRVHPLLRVMYSALVPELLPMPALLLIARLLVAAVGAVLPARVVVDREVPGDGVDALGLDLEGVVAAPDAKEAHCADRGGGGGDRVSRQCSICAVRLRVSAIYFERRQSAYSPPSARPTSCARPNRARSSPRPSPRPRPEPPCRTWNFRGTPRSGGCLIVGRGAGGLRRG